MEFVSEYGLFLAKAVTVVVAIGFLMLVIAAAKRGDGEDERGSITVRKLNQQYDAYRDAMREAVLEPEAFKQLIKAEEKDKKAEHKVAKEKAKKAGKDTAAEPEKRLFVLNFDGDIKASPVDAMREEISALLSVAQTGDEVVLRLESGGGMVHSYGLASSQLDRIAKAGINLTVCVDKVAASGGYMMACVADKILAAPFAIIGSIGVLAQVPNIHRLLKKHDVDVEILTAGEYKRTLTMLGENTDKGRAKFMEELEQTHELFKGYVGERRPNLDIAAVATGEVWYGSQAIGNGLIDEIMTSDEYLQQAAVEYPIYEIAYEHKKTVAEKLGLSVEGSVDRLASKWWDRAFYQR
ncbi:MAG: protease SohB, partial [Cellvibrionaceae bacterium]|nr:protease SohB [Cellvibrionaceae bacterium]